MPECVETFWFQAAENCSGFSKTAQDPRSRGTFVQTRALPRKTRRSVVKILGRGRKFLDTAHWVGAIKRGAEGSHMQLQDMVCPPTKA